MQSRTQQLTEAAMRRSRPAKQQPTAPVVTRSIQESVVIFILTIRAPGNERRIRDKDILVTDADKDRLAVTKKLIDAPEHKAIQSNTMEVRHYIKRMALPSPFKEGIYALPVELIDAVDKRMQQFADERRDTVAKLVKVYDKVKAAARRELGALYNEADYATDLEYAYRMEWQYVSLTAPTQLQQRDGKLYSREQERLQRQWDEAITDMRDALRMGLSELVNDIVQRLTADSDKKVKPSKLLERFNEFLNVFQARNVTGDEQLEALAEQARKLLAGVDTDTLVKSADIRQQVAKGFSGVQKTLAKLELESKGRRRITFADE